MSPIRQSRTRCPECRSTMLFDGWFDEETEYAHDGTGPNPVYGTVCNNCGWVSWRKAPKQEGTR